MLTDGPFLCQVDTVGPIFDTYSKDLTRCLSSPSKDVSRSCIDAAFKSANKKVTDLCLRPFSGDLVVYRNAYQTWTCFFDRPRILNWLKTSVPEQIVSRKNAALNIVNNDFAHYGKCLLKNEKDAIACYDTIHNQLQNDLKEQWRSLLTTTVDTEQCREYHNQYYTARNNIKKPAADFSMLTCRWPQLAYDKDCEIP